MTVDNFDFRGLMKAIGHYVHSLAVSAEQNHLHCGMPVPPSPSTALSSCNPPPLSRSKTCSYRKELLRRHRFLELQSVAVVFLPAGLGLYLATINARDFPSIVFRGYRRAG